MTFDLSEDEAYGVRIAVNTILRDVYLLEGVEIWWTRERDQLGGRTPEQVLHEDPTSVVMLAMSAREMG